MEFNIIKDTQTWDNIEPEWNRLMQKCASRVPFLEHAYLKAWWTTRGGGEWNPDQTQLQIITAEQDGHLVGIAPFFKGQNRQDQPSLMFLGCVEVSDYLDFIVSAGDLPEFIPALLEYLKLVDDPAFKLLDLYNLPDATPSIPLLQQGAQSTGWNFTLEKLQSSPYITLPGDWETYLANLDKKQRHEIRRKLRRVDEESETSWYFVTEPKALESETRAFLDMMALDPEKKAFLTQLMQDHILNTTQLAMTHGWLHLAFLKINAQKAAAYLSFQYDQRLWIYNSAWNLQFAQYSPGWILLAKIVQWGMENGINELDFMRGDESYKYKFGGVDRFVMQARLQRD